MPGNQPPHTVITFGTFEADLQTRELRKLGVPIPLPGHSFQVLKILLERPGELATPEDFRTALWPSETFVDFEYGIRAAVHRLREALGDSAEHPKYIETLPRRGYRFIAPIDSQAQSKKAPLRSSHVKWLAIPLLASVMALAAAAYFYFLRTPKLTNKDTIVLSDFDNKTGDVVFDGTLRQGLAAQLEQSPFLSVISDQRIQETLRLMGQPPDAKLTPHIARELCLRTNSGVVIDGSIAQIGTQYLLTLKAINCASGNSLASAETQASDKNRVLEVLGKASSDIRKKLGESPQTLERFDTPLERATTPSLEALQSFSLGRKAALQNADQYSAIPLLQQAVKLDPNFATAYALLGSTYSDMGETTLASANLQKAFDLRHGASAREKLSIEARYQLRVTGNLEKAHQLYEVWIVTYPRDWDPKNSLANIYLEFGQYERALAEHRRALSLYPEGDLLASNVAGDLVYLNRFAEAQALNEQLEKRNPDSWDVQVTSYILAFLRNDNAQMQRQVELVASKSPLEDYLFANHSATTAYAGRLQRARTLSALAIASARRIENNERAADDQNDSAITEALFGNKGVARQQASMALRLSFGRIVQCRAALALALADEKVRAKSLYDDLNKRFPEDTMIQSNCLPILDAQLALDRHEPSRVIEALKTALPYELSLWGPLTLYPAYLRGTAYLALNRSTEANSEFKKILDHPGVVVNSPIGALAHLQIARSYAMQGDTAKARTAYQDFLTLWRDADPNIPILIAAKAEYAKLQ